MQTNSIFRPVLLIKFFDGGGSQEAISYTNVEVNT